MSRIRETSAHWGTYLVEVSADGRDLVAAHARPDEPDAAPEIADCVNGNVNVLTRDVGTSTLTQATSGAHVLVAVTRYDGPVPPVRAYEPPPLVER